MRNKLLKLNTVTSLTYQIVNIICGFILPRLILMMYGSEVNGLVNSITQFLQIITFFELGIGAVVQSALYKPLADKDHVASSRIVVSAQRFFNKLGTILLVYIVVLIATYPYISDSDFDWIYSGLLIAAIGISLLSQYYFGAVDALFLSADQHGYISYSLRTATVVLNTVACAVLIYLGASIHVVKLTTSLIFLIRPIIMRIYISKHYTLNRRIKYDEEPIKQKWNGVAQHVAAVVIDGTANIVLTVFSTLSSVSVYSVYHLVIYGVRHLFMSLTDGIQPLIGELWAKKDTPRLHSTFGWMEWIVHTGTIFIFGCTGILVVPFVTVYTKGITDVNYIQPLFGILLTAANAVYCLRLPYSVMILAGGHYKQTQMNYIIAAIINIIISVSMVIAFGLVGIAIGMLVAMLYQIAWMAIYVSKNLIKWPIKKLLRQTVLDIVIIATASLATFWIPMHEISYLSWAVLAVEVALIWLAVILVVNLIFNRNYLKAALGKVIKSK